MFARFYFVTFNTYKDQRLLARPEVHEVLPIDGIALPTWVQSLRTVIGKRLLRLEIPKPHWQEGFFDHLLRSHESYAQKWDYVRLNPVRAKLSQTPETWPYQGEIVPIPFD
jgi:hypothetical protein